MNVAQLTRHAGVCFAYFAWIGWLGGCVLVEPVTSSFGIRQRVVIQQDYAGYEEIQAVSQFSTYLKGLTPEAVGKELQSASLAFEQTPNVVNRFKYVLTLFYVGDDDVHSQKALSLLGDRSISEKEAAAFWLFFADHFGAMFQRQVVAKVQQRQGVEERNKLIIEIAALRVENDNLKKELQTKAAQLSKVEGQVSQLKTIEKSILERNQTEDVVKP